MIYKLPPVFYSRTHSEGRKSLTSHIMTDLYIQGPNLECSRGTTLPIKQTDSDNKGLYGVAISFLSVNYDANRHFIEQNMCLYCH